MLAFKPLSSHSECRHSGGSKSQLALALHLQLLVLVGEQTVPEPQVPEQVG
jgi:hypothetical protein